MVKKLKIHFNTMGCKVNQYDTEALKTIFMQKDHNIVNDPSEADVLVINTCTVTHLADRKARRNIRKLKRENPNSLVAVVGCYPQVQPEKVSAMPEVDIILGTDQRSKLAELVEAHFTEKSTKTTTKTTKSTKKSTETLAEINPSRKRNGYEALRVQSFNGMQRSRHFLKVQEGCDQFCAYCVVPFARGELRSRPLDAILEEAKRALEADFKELVLTGINLGAYGREDDRIPHLAEVVDQITRLNGNYRVRLSSLEPQEIDQILIDQLVENPRVCAHFHIPLQSGDNEILAWMGRDYTVEEYVARVENIRNKAPDIALTTDVIVGFPGEKAHHFKNTYQFIKQLGFSRLHVFPFSPRAYTKAAQYQGHVNSQVKKERSEQLRELGQALARQYQQKFIGDWLELLIESIEEHNDETWALGLSSNYLSVYVKNAGRNTLNQLLHVKIDGGDAKGLTGWLV